MPATVTDTAAIRDLRAVCETKILQLLKQLCADTGYSLEGVTVRTAVTVPDLSPGSSDEPMARPFAVKIVLAV